LDIKAKIEAWREEQEREEREMREIDQTLHIHRPSSVDPGNNYFLLTQSVL
jgi:hypothetical protein